MIIDFLSAEPVPFSHYKVINGAQEVNNLMVKAVNGRLKGVVLYESSLWSSSGPNNKD